MSNQTSDFDLPSVDELENEYARVKKKKDFRKILKNSLYVLIIASAVAVLVAVLYMPVLKIVGNSMTPGLSNGDLIVSVKSKDLNYGDVVAFYYNNRILVKRVIGKPGDWVDITKDGVVSVNGEELKEPYVDGLSIGECDIILPCQVPDSKYFVMGDHRNVSIDSRNSAIGFVDQEQVVGKLLFRVWPLNQLGTVN